MMALHVAKAVLLLALLSLIDYTSAVNGRKGGGLRQRLGISKGKAKPKSNLGGWFGKMWKRGKLSPQDVQSGAQAACRDGCAGGEVGKLARIGGAGKFSGNGHRDLMRQLGSRMPLTYQALVPVWDVVADKATETVMNFLLPFEVLESLIPDDDIADFTQFRSDQITMERDLQNWCNVHNAPRERTIALGMWGDAAPYSKKDSVNVVLFNILTGGKRSLKRYWICTFTKSRECRCGCQGRHTWDGIWSVIVWCFVSLFAAVFPSARHDGIPWHESPYKNDKHRANRVLEAVTNPILTRFRFHATLLRMRGDWSFQKNVLGLRGWKDGAGCCWKCPCTRKGLYEVGEQASWKQKVYTHTSWLAHVMLASAYVMPLLGIPGFTIACIAADLMHAGDLGVIQYLLGNVLWDLFQTMGGTLKNNRTIIANLCAFMQMAAKKLDIESPCGALTMSMIRLAGCKPKFKLKAAEGRRGLKVLNFMLQNFFSPTCEVEHQRQICVAKLTEMYDEMEPLKWDRTTSKPLIVKLYGQFMGMYLEINRYKRENVCMYETFYRVYPKFHMLCHVIEDSPDNPRDEWTYIDEGEIGDAAKVASTLHPSSLHRSLMETYRVG